jgi:hypothetical protein
LPSHSREAVRPEVARRGYADFRESIASAEGNAATLIAWAELFEVVVEKRMRWVGPDFAVVVPTVPCVECGFAGEPKRAVARG